MGFFRKGPRSLIAAGPFLQMRPFARRLIEGIKDSTVPDPVRKGSSALRLVGDNPVLIGEGSRNGHERRCDFRGNQSRSPAVLKTAQPTQINEDGRWHARAAYMAIEAHFTLECFGNRGGTIVPRLQQSLDQPPGDSRHLVHVGGCPKCGNSAKWTARFLGDILPIVLAARAPRAKHWR